MDETEKLESKAVEASRSNELLDSAIEALRPFAELAVQYNGQFGAKDLHGLGTAVGSVSPVDLRAARKIVLAYDKAKKKRI